MAKAKKRYDVASVREAACGQWLDILSALGGVGLDVLDSRNHPCPKCGGEDRFRAFNDCRETGGLFCNQCFNKGNGDGFASLAWLLGIEMPAGFLEVVEKIATYVGVKPTSDSDPAKDLEWREWAPALAKIFCAMKPGITEEALLANGARMAQYKKQFKVIAIPIIGESLDNEKPTGWVIAQATGATLPKYNRSGEVVGQVGWKTTHHSGSGFCGTHAIARLTTPGLVETCWKCEGMSDFLTLFSAIPPGDRDRIACLTNAHGTSQLPRWMAGVLASVNVNIVHDADEPGQAGAETWAIAVSSQQRETTTRNVRLPYDIAPKKGKDLRDYLNEGRTYADLAALAEREPIINAVKKPSGDGATDDYSNYKHPHYERVLKCLQLEVLYEDKSGAIRLFSTLLRKSSTVRDVTRLRKHHLVQICGPPALEYITSDSPDGESTFSMTDVQGAIALFAGLSRGREDERGVGVWQGIDRWGNQVDTIVLVNRADGARWNGDRVLRQIIAPRADGLVLDLGGDHEDWFDFETLDQHIKSAADPEWRYAALTRCRELLERWKWRNPDVDPTLVVGLILASYIQTIWDWRPLVSITGATNSGKSMLFEFLGGSEGRRGLFGGLAFKQAKSSEAGIRQGIGNTACVILCDEFEKSKERDRIFEMFRAATRGEAIAKGTSDQKGTRFRLRHIAWMAAIESGLHRNPDMNRMVQLELIPVPKGMPEANRLKHCDGHELIELGHRLLAIAVRGAGEAKRLATAMKDEQVAGIDPRTVECYAVPAAILAVAMGFGDAKSRELLTILLTNVEIAEQGGSDDSDLLGEIVSSTVRLPPPTGERTVGQILESVSLLTSHTPALEAVGVKLLGEEIWNGEDRGRVFINHKIVSTKLLRGSTWEGQRIDQLLLRIAGAERRQLRMNGRPVRGVLLPRYCVTTPFMAESGEPVTA